MNIVKAKGDQSGELIVRPDQSVSFNFSDGFVPFSLHGRNGSHVKLPSLTKCRGVGIIMSGTLYELKNLTVGSQCHFALTNTIATSFSFDHVLIQRLGQLTVKNRDEVEVSISGITFSVHGGGKVRCLHSVLNNSSLMMMMLKCVQCKLNIAENCVIT